MQARLLKYLRMVGTPYGELFRAPTTHRLAKSTTAIALVRKFDVRAKTSSCPQKSPAISQRAATTRGKGKKNKPTPDGDDENRCVVIQRIIELPLGSSVTLS